MKCLRVLGLLGLGLFGSALSIHAASAQVVVSGNYYEEFKSVSCGTANACLLLFSATPQQVFITDVSCQILTTGTAPVYDVALAVSDTAAGTGSPRRVEHVIPVSIIANAWIVRSKIGFLYGGGKWPEIIVGTSGAVSSMSVACKISGTFVVP
jgi:hypothetical protein